MGSRKINRKKITQRKKYKKIGNRLLNTQKRIRKQSKINRQLKRKQTCKINRCKKCKGVKNLKISKKKLDRLRNAGGIRSSMRKAASSALSYVRNSSCLCSGNQVDERARMHEGLDKRREAVKRIHNHLEVELKRSPDDIIIEESPESSSYSSGDMMGPARREELAAARKKRQEDLAPYHRARKEEESQWEAKKAAALARRNAAATNIQRVIRARPHRWLAAEKREIASQIKFIEEYNKNLARQNAMYGEGSLEL